jgi:hypothetical protein
VRPLNIRTTISCRKTKPNIINNDSDLSKFLSLKNSECLHIDGPGRSLRKLLCCIRPNNYSNTIDSSYCWSSVMDSRLYLSMLFPSLCITYMQRSLCLGTPSGHHAVLLLRTIAIRKILLPVWWFMVLRNTHTHVTHTHTSSSFAIHILYACVCVCVERERERERERLRMCKYARNATLC